MKLFLALFVLLIASPAYATEADWAAEYRPTEVWRVEWKDKVFTAMPEQTVVQVKKKKKKRQFILKRMIGGVWANIDGEIHSCAMAIVLSN